MVDNVWNVRDAITKQPRPQFAPRRVGTAVWQAALCSGGRWGRIEAAGTVRGWEINAVRPSACTRTGIGTVRATRSERNARCKRHNACCSSMPPSAYPTRYRQVPPAQAPAQRAVVTRERCRHIRVNAAPASTSVYRHARDKCPSFNGTPSQPYAARK